MDATPENNFVQFTCYQEDDEETFFGGFGPDLTHENKLNSNMGRGHLQYTVPSLSSLLEGTGVDISQIDNVWCEVSVTAINAGGGTTVLECKSSQCKGKFEYSYTPAFRRILPQAVFFNTRTTFFVDVENTQSYRVTGDEMPFRMGFIDNSNTNYEIWLDETSTFTSWYTNEISGQSGDAPVNQTSVPRINFHTGDALLVEDRMKTCNYDETDCYYVKSIAVVDSFEHTTGYASGGQYLEFRGTRLLGEENTVVTIDGVACEIQTSKLTKETGTCLTGAASTSTSGSYGDYVGGYGLRRAMYESDGADSVIDVDDIASHADDKVGEELLMAFEYPNESSDEGN